MKTKFIKKKKEKKIILFTFSFLQFLTSHIRSHGTFFTFYFVVGKLIDLAVSLIKQKI